MRTLEDLTFEELLFLADVWLSVGCYGVSSIFTNELMNRARGVEKKTSERIVMI